MGRNCLDVFSGGFFSSLVLGVGVVGGCGGRWFVCLLSFDGDVVWRC